MDDKIYMLRRKEQGVIQWYDEENDRWVRKQKDGTQWGYKTGAYEAQRKIEKEYEKWGFHIELEIVVVE